MANKTNDGVSYRQLSDKLNQIIDKLRDDELDPDEATKLYQDGVSTIKQLETSLKAAENVVKKLKTNE